MTLKPTSNESPLVAQRAATHEDELPQARILVADDDRLVRSVLTSALQAAGYEVSQAANGREALNQLEQAEWDVVLLDVQMPDLNGLQVLDEIRRRRPLEMMPVVMVTAQSEPQMAVKALAAGANDFLTKPIHLAVVLAHVRTQLQLRRSILSLAEAAARQNAELQEAARIQRARLPAERVLQFGDYRAAWFCDPHHELGGDHLSVSALSDVWLALSISDVSGCGVSAAMYSVGMSQALDIALRNAAQAPGAGASDALSVVAPAEILVRLHRQFAFNPAVAKFATLLYGVLHRPTGRFTYVCAGHPPPLVLRDDGSLVALPGEGLPLGMVEADALHVETQEYAATLHPGDRLLLYTDGLIEVADAGGKLLAAAGLAQALAAGRSLPLVEALLDLRERVCALSASGRIEDDAAALLLERE